MGVKVKGKQLALAPISDHAPTCENPDRCSGRCLWTVPDLRERFNIWPAEKTSADLWEEL